MLSDIGASHCQLPRLKKLTSPQYKFQLLMLLQILALMVLRQRGMRLTIITILDDLAAKLPPVRNNLELVRRQFSQRFKHEDIMMQQITPPGFNAAEKVSLLFSLRIVWHPDVC